MRLAHPVWAALPGPLLLLISTAATEEQRPTAIRKMPPGEGEKFFPHYVAFPPALHPQDAGAPFANVDADLDEPRGRRRAAAAAVPGGGGSEDGGDLNSTSPARQPFSPAFAAHLDYHDGRQHAEAVVAGRPLGGEHGAAGGRERGQEQYRRSATALARLERRQWGCPSGTNSCISIGYPYSCCRVGETCYQIRDTGLGPVGCCAQGATCGGTINNCAPGDLACPSELGGGCCIAGFVCQGLGCVLTSITSRTQPPTSQPTTQTSTSTTLPPNPSSASTTTSGGSTQPPPTSSSATTATSTSTTDGNGPIRPTLTETNYCPTGFYACLASASGGCCQTGRDCATASCPPPVPSTTIISGGVTVVIPVPSDQQGPRPRTCAAGWYLCGADAGPLAGCCPTGYGCGTASCTYVTAGATATVQKEFPSGSSGGRGRSSRLGLAVVGLAGLVTAAVVLL